MTGGRQTRSSLPACSDRGSHGRYDHAMSPQKRCDVNPGGEIPSDGGVSLALSLVVPVYNEEACLRELYHRLVDALKRTGETYEIIFVDDGSTDGTGAVLEELHASDPAVRLVELARNFGQHNALSAGFWYSEGSIVVTLDADLQNPPEEIPRLVAKIREGYDLVFGIAPVRQHSWFRVLGSRVSRYLLRQFIGIPSSQISTFRAIRRPLIERLRGLPERSRFIDGLLCWLGARVAVVQVSHGPRYRGDTKYSVLRLVGLWLTMVTSFSDLPLRISTFVGSLVAISGIGLGFYYMAKRLFLGIPVPGFATIVIVVLWLSGVQLFCLGMLGEYLSRVYTEVKGRPPFVVRRTLGLD